MKAFDDNFSQKDVALTSVLLGAIFFLAPLFPQLSHPKFEFLFRSSLYLIIAVILVRIGFAAAFARWKTVPYLFPAVLFLLWLGVTISYSPAIYRAVDKFSIHLAALLLFLVLYSLPLSKKIRITLAWCLAAGGMLAAIHGLYLQWVGFDEFITQMKELALYDETMRKEMIASLEANRAMGRFSNPNHLAGYLVLTLWMLWYLWKEKQSRIVLSLFCLPVFICIYQTYSRSGILAFVLTGIFMAGYEMQKRGWLRKSRAYLKVILAALSIVFLLIAGTVVMIIFLQPDWAADSFFGGRLMTISTIKARIHFYQGALSIIEQYPMLGVGPESFESYYSQVLRPGNAESRYVHSWFLEAALEGGIVAAFLLFWLLCAVGLYLWNHAKRKPHTPAVYAAFGAGLVFLFFSMIDFTNNLMEYWIIPLFFLAMIDRGSFSKIKESPWITWAGYGFCLFLACAWFYLGFCRYLNETYREQGNMLAMDGQRRAAIQAYEKAVMFDWSDAESWRDLSRQWAQIPSPQAQFQRLRYARMAVKWAPRRASMHAGLADALFVLGYREQALEEIKIAQELFPARPIHYEQHAEMLRQMGFEEKAKEKLNQAEKIKETIERRKL